MAERHTSLILRIKPYVYMAGAAFTLIAMALATVEAIYSRNLDSTFENIEIIQTEYLDVYLADAEFLEKSMFAKLERTGNDAGPTLNSMVYWYPSAEMGRKSPLVEPKSREFLLRYNDDWIKARTFLERGTIKADIGFFQELSRFQYWDIEKNSPLEHIIAVGEFVHPAKMPIPESLDLLTAVKVRLIKGSIDGAPLAALKEVRQLAVLLLTTENYQLVMTGLTALELERRAYREYVEREWLPHEAWSPIDRNTSMRASRSFAATSGYLRVITRPAIFNRIFSKEHVLPGFCSALNEQLPMEFAFRTQLSGWWPFERNFEAGFERIDGVFEEAKKICRLRYLRKLQAKDTFSDSLPNGPWPLTRLPYFRALFALNEWSTWPTHFDGYQRR